MITINQWKQFNKYRDEVSKKVSTRIKKLPKLQLNYEKGIANMMRNKFKADIYSLQIDMLRTEIPPKTIEACLDWLIYK